MASQNYSYNSSKPAFSAIDDDESAFLSSGGPKYLAADKLPMSAEERALQEAEERRRAMLLQMNQIEQRTLDSSKRSLGLLAESENIGIETAEDLTRQREQLENTDRRLDEIKGTLKDTQKNINGIKSVFSSLRQWWSTPKNGKGKGDGKDKIEEESKEKIPPKMSSHLAGVVDKSNKSVSYNQDSDHPALRIKGYGEDDDSVPETLAQFREHSKKVDAQLERDLDSMSSGLSRLKGLAQGLGAEVQDQNELLDRINTKVDDSEVTIGSQNKQINRILKS